MPDPLCTLMGVCDVLAGILILLTFSNTFAIIFSLMMVFKGAISFF